MTRFAILTPSLAQPGGAERTILIQVRYGDPARMRCTGVAISGHGMIDEDLGVELLKHTSIHSDTPRERWRSARGPNAVCTDHPNLNAAVLHICRDADALITWGSLSMARFTDGLGIPVVCVSHCSSDVGRAVTGVTHLVAVSEAARRYWSRAPAPALPVAVIPNGVEVDRAAPRHGRDWQRARWGIRPGEKVLLYLGRQAVDKNPAASIHALSQLPPDHRLVMVGNRPASPDQPQPELVKLAADLGVSGRVLFLPATPFVGDVLAGADCLLHLSLREADSLVVKEAFLAGLPVVHTPVGAIPEMTAEFGPLGWAVGLDTLRADTACIDPGEVACRVRDALSDAAAPVVAKTRALAWDRWTGPAMCERWADYLDAVVAGWDYPPGWGPRAAPGDEVPIGPPPRLTSEGALPAPVPAAWAALSLTAQHPVACTPADPDRPRPLPREIVLPTEKALRTRYGTWTIDQMVGSIVGLAEGLAHDVWRLDGVEHAVPNSARSSPLARPEGTGRDTVVIRSDELEPLDWSAFPIRVDGVEVIVDFADWHLISPHASRHAHWLRFHFHSSDKAYPFLGALMVSTFLDWADYDRFQRGVRDARDPATATLILNNQNAATGWGPRERRRFMVQGLLRHHFGDRADFACTGQAAYFAKAGRALCSVHVPGSFENSLDRGQLQMIGLGVPTISPVMIDQCGDGLLQPGVHYLACRHDYRDIPDLVRWCEDHREEAAAIGHNAWMFFQEFCTPLAVWSYVKDRIDHGPRHARGTIDDELSPPGLYDPGLVEG